MEKIVLCSKDCCCPVLLVRCEFDSNKDSYDVKLTDDFGGTIIYRHFSTFAAMLYNLKRNAQKEKLDSRFFQYSPAAPEKSQIRISHQCYCVHLSLKQFYNLIEIGCELMKRYL